MTDFIAITEAETNPGAPSKSSLWKRWAKNWIAGFEGAPGAPRLKFEAVDTWLTTPGAVGSLAFLGQVTGGAAIVAGSDYAGSNLGYAGTNDNGIMQVGPALTGTTWRALGAFSSGGGYRRGTLFIRVA